MFLLSCTFFSIRARLPRINDPSPFRGRDGVMQCTALYPNLMYAKALFRSDGEKKLLDFVFYILIHVQVQGRGGVEAGGGRGGGGTQRGVVCKPLVSCGLVKRNCTRPQCEGTNRAMVEYGQQYGSIV